MTAYLINAVASVACILYLYLNTKDVRLTQESEKMITFCVIALLVCFAVELNTSVYLFARKLLVYQEGLELRWGMREPVFVPFHKIQYLGIQNSLFLGKQIMYSDGMITTKVPVDDADDLLNYIDHVRHNQGR